MSAFTDISESTLRQWGFPDGPIDISYPFENYGDNKSIIVKRDYLVDARYRLSMPLDTDIDAETAALVKVEFDRLILVSQTSAGEDCGLARVTRTFATIPQDHIERGAQNVQLYGLSMQAGAWQQAWVSSSKYGGITIILHRRLRFDDALLGVLHGRRRLPHKRVGRSALGHLYNPPILKRVLAQRQVESGPHGDG